MFAIAAFALGGLGFSPAFATVATTNQAPDVDDGTTYTSGWESTNCKYSTDTCESKIRVYNDNPSDKVKVYYNVDNAQCDVSISWYNEGVEQGSPWTRDNYSGTGASTTKYFNIEDTDAIAVTVTYSNCI